jgi:hypothetical protein
MSSACFEHGIDHVAAALALEKRAIKLEKRAIKASLILWLVWGMIAWQMAARLPWPAGLIVLPLGYIVGLVLGNMGRVEVEKSDRLGQVLAIIASR